MIRILQSNGAQKLNSMYKAAVDLTTGFAVETDFATKEVSLPTAAKGINLKFVDKERIATGPKAAYDYLSDYDEAYTAITAGEYVLVWDNFEQGTVFATDAFATDITAFTEGDLLEAGTDGKLKAASGASAYKFRSVYDDAGHTLGAVEVLNVAES